jgi:hypothetical protein
LAFDIKKSKMKELGIDIPKAVWYSRDIRRAKPWYLK